MVYQFACKSLLDFFVFSYFVGDVNLSKMSFSNTFCQVYCVILHSFIMVSLYYNVVFTVRRLCANLFRATAFHIQFNSYYLNIINSETSIAIIGSVEGPTATYISYILGYREIFSIIVSAIAIILFFIVLFSIINIRQSQKNNSLFSYCEKSR